MNFNSGIAKNSTFERGRTVIECGYFQEKKFDQSLDAKVIWEYPLKRNSHHAVQTAYRLLDLIKAFIGATKFFLNDFARADMTRLKIARGISLRIFQ